MVVSPHLVQSTAVSTIVYSAGCLVKPRNSYGERRSTHFCFCICTFIWKQEVFMNVQHGRWLICIRALSEELRYLPGTFFSESSFNTSASSSGARIVAHWVAPKMAAYKFKFTMRSDLAKNCSCCLWKKGRYCGPLHAGSSKKHFFFEVDTDTGHSGRAALRVCF